MVNPRDKGARAETVVRDLMRKCTGLKWERTPGSGALDVKHQLKGDLYVPGEGNLFAVEVKHYKDDHLSSTLLTGKNPQLFEWWDQAVRQGEQMDKSPLLIFKHDRSKVFCAFSDMPNTDLNYLYVDINNYNFFIALLEEWISKEQPKFIK
jgi:hypothetical protein